MIKGDLERSIYGYKVTHIWQFISQYFSKTVKFHICLKTEPVFNSFAKIFTFKRTSQWLFHIPVHDIYLSRLPCGHWSQPLCQCCLDEAPLFAILSAIGYLKLLKEVVEI